MKESLVKKVFHKLVEICNIGIRGFAMLNKSVAKYYLQWKLNLTPLPLRSDAFFIDLIDHLLVSVTLYCTDMLYRFWLNHPSQRIRCMKDDSWKILWLVLHMLSWLSQEGIKTEWLGPRWNSRWRFHFVSDEFRGRMCSLWQQLRLYSEPKPYFPLTTAWKWHNLSGEGAGASQCHPLFPLMAMLHWETDMRCS